ncbi:MAG TPA: glycosyltransferase [Acidimicrobiales bacterium]
MSRYLMTVWPFVGHINPFVSVAEVLRDRGHEVAFYTSPKLRAQLEGMGFTLFPYERVEEDKIWAVIQAAETKASLGWHAPGLLLRAFRDWLAGTVPGQVADIGSIVDRWRPDVIVTETAMWGPIVVLSEAGRVPVAILTTLMGCLIPGPDSPPWGPGLPPPRNPATRLLARAVARAGDLLAAPVRRRVNQARAGHGLPPMAGSVNAFMARLPLYLVPSVPALDYDRRDLPPGVHYVGPCVWNKPAEAPPPPWLAGVPTDRPWVHVTEGTAHYQDPFVLRAAARGLAGRPMEVIMTTGSHRDPAALDLGPIAPNVRVERWVSHSDLLPRCAALVTTGGAGTVMAALQAGVPQLIVPTHWDKPDNARRVVEAGAGLSLTPRQCTPAALRGAVDRLLHEPRFRDRARELAGELAAEPGPSRAAELLESLALSAATPPAAGGEPLTPGDRPLSVA